MTVAMDNRPQPMPVNLKGKVTHLADTVGQIQESYGHVRVEFMSYHDRTEHTRKNSSNYFVNYIKFLYI